MKARRTLRWAALIALTVLYVAPILWMVLTAFKTEEESAASPPTFLPSQWSSEALDTIFASSAQTPVLRWFLNSVIAALGTGAVVLVTAAPAAYALARMEFRGKRLVFGGIVATLFVPPIIFLAPNYEIVEALGWLDSLPAVIFPVAAGAFGVFFLRQFFIGLPLELEEAALLDGASRFQVFTRIVLPLSKPALATLFLLTVLTNWNDFLWPLYVLFNPEHLTLSPGLGLLQGANQTNYALLMAGGLVASLPVLALFAVAQRYIIEGVSRSGLKG
ncbi:MAG: multiple sugar transport system permease protein [Actinomycetota bacterium]